VRVTTSSPLVAFFAGASAIFLNLLISIIPTAGLCFLLWWFAEVEFSWKIFGVIWVVITICLSLQKPPEQSIKMQLK
jgi:hypothetical protein